MADCKLAIRIYRLQNPYLRIVVRTGLGQPVVQTRLGSTRMHAPPSASESLRNSLNTETFKTLLSAPRFARGFSPEPYPRRAFEHGVSIALFRAPAARENQRPTGPTWAIRRISIFTGYAASRPIRIDLSRSESIRVECIRSGRPYPGHRVAEAHTAAVGRQPAAGCQWRRGRGPT